MDTNMTIHMESEEQKQPLTREAMLRDADALLEEFSEDYRRMAE